MLTYCGDSFTVHINFESLRCTPEINIMLYISYTSNKKRKDK